ncbi:hypothetical protein ACJZ2D_012980 [Fusarium nematophilum]
MSNYNGRRGPNVSQYLRDLNAINRQEPSDAEPFNMEEDLALFTNTQFFDFETGQNTDYQAHPVKADMEAAPSTSPSDGMTPAPSVVGELSNFDFIQSEPARMWPAWDVKLDLSGWMGNGVYGAISRDLPTPITTSTGTPAPLPKLERLLPQASWSLLQHQLFFNRPCLLSFFLLLVMILDFFRHPLTTERWQSAPQPAAEKHKSESGPGAGRPLNFEEASRHAAEEDKRRRNTAASARFRIKKKQREQALEKSAKEMSEKVSVLESKVQQLEMENKWLKNLLVEKNEGNDEIVTLWKEFAASKATDKKAESKSGSSVKEESR